MLIFSFVQADPHPRPRKEKAIFIDENLFKRMGGNDMTALDELYHLTERTMYAFSLSLTRNHQEALDLMQDMYIKVLSAAHLYKPQGKPLAWMFTITKNIFYTKTQRSRRIFSIDPEIMYSDMNFSYVEDLEDRLVLEGVLSLLTKEERNIVLLYAVSGMKHKQIAESLDLKLSTVLSKYHRSLKKLRAYLQEEEVRV